MPATPSPGLSRPDPKTQQIVDDLRRRILAGEFGKDGKLPTENALCTDWGVSRATVRPAYARLIEEGLVTSQERGGYWVHLIQPILLRLDAPGRDAADDEGEKDGSWERAVRAHDRQPRTRVTVSNLGGADAPVPPEILERLKLDADDLVVARKRICYVDDVPYMLVIAYYPEELARGTILSRPGAQSAPGGLLAAIGHPAAGKPDDIWRARMATREEAKDLALPRVTPCTDWLRTRFAKDGTPLVVIRYLLPGDRIALARH
jgi:GntR family transcriptional regulator